jgi:GATA-binding protein
MNLDDFIVAENVATPAGFIATPSPEATKHEAEQHPSHSQATAIPIKSRKEASQHFVPQSVPVPPHHQRNQDEFGYVTRHHRKTSIDERRVSLSLFWMPMALSMRLYKPACLPSRHLSLSLLSLFPPLLAPIMTDNPPFSSI